MSRVALSGGETCPTDIRPPENNSNSRSTGTSWTSGQKPAEISLLSLEGEHMLAHQLVQASCLMPVASCNESLCLTTLLSSWFTAVLFLFYTRE